MPTLPLAELEDDKGGGECVKPHNLQVKAQLFSRVKRFCSLHKGSWVCLTLSLGITALLTESLPNAHAAKYPWAKQAGAIQGRWSVTCKESAGMVIEFTAQGSKATGRVVQVGLARRYGYSQGEEIFQVAATDLGKWVGKLKWRSVAGTVRWDSITFVVGQDRLDAVQTTDYCYKDMPRAR
jgi:hypothetical protein